VAQSKIAELRSENSGLRRLVIHLSKMIIRDIADQGGVSGLRSKEVAPRLLVAIMPDEVVPLLREASLYCAHASRDSLDGRTAQELEGISVELADAAQNLETLFLAPKS
jgi:hypothetical protein